jgi:hypothetical protein
MLIVGTMGRIIELRGAKIERVRMVYCLDKGEGREGEGR